MPVDETTRNISDYPSGSEWRRWDLHIHMPETNKNDAYAGSTSEEKWENNAEGTGFRILSCTANSSVRIWSPTGCTARMPQVFIRSWNMWNSNVSCRSGS